MDATSSLEDAPSDENEDERSLRRAAFLTAGVGFAHAVLFVASYWLLTRAPGAHASDADIIAFYGSTDRRQLLLVGLYVMPFAGIAFLWFIVALRMWISGNVRRENVLFSNMQLVSGILFIALFFIAAAASASLAASIEFSESPVDPSVAHQFPEFSATILMVFAMRMAAIFVFMTSNIGRTANILPRWFTYAGFGVGVFLLLSATFSSLFVLVFPAWLVVLCILLLGQPRPESAGIPARHRAGRCRRTARHDSGWHLCQDRHPARHPDCRGGLRLVAGRNHQLSWPRHRVATVVDMAGGADDVYPGLRGRLCIPRHCDHLGTLRALSGSVAGHCRPLLQSGIRRHRASGGAGNGCCVRRDAAAVQHGHHQSHAASSGTPQSHHE